MSEAHWIDALGKTLASGSSRRSIPRTAGALAAGLLLGGAPHGGTAADPCDRFFSKQKDRDFCRVKRKRCKNAGTSFCIVEGDPADPAKLATCCHRGDECCGRECCGKVHVGDKVLPQRCCDKETSLCCPRSWECCPDDAQAGTGCCETDRGFACCPGVGCVDIENDPNHCGGCGRSCGAGEQCVDRGCRSGGGGGCRDADCPPGQRCHDGACGCADGYKYCPAATRCVEERVTCCGGLLVSYCVVGMVCCGSGVGAYCIHPGNPCMPRNEG